MELKVVSGRSTEKMISLWPQTPLGPLGLGSPTSQSWHEGVGEESKLCPGSLTGYTRKEASLGWRQPDPRSG